LNELCLSFYWHFYPLPEETAIKKQLTYHGTNKFDHIQYNRDIAEPFIEIEGE